MPSMLEYLELVLNSNDDYSLDQINEINEAIEQLNTAIANANFTSGKSEIKIERVTRLTADFLKSIQKNPKNIKRLNVFGLLITLPKEIALLKSLVYINLRANKIEWLPEEMSSLVNLVGLQLGQNQIREFPKVLLQLNNLNNLDIEYNKLETLPSELGLLDSLESIAAGWNPFSQMNPLAKYYANKSYHEPDNLKNILALKQQGLEYNTQAPVAPTYLPQQQLTFTNQNAYVDENGVMYANDPSDQEDAVCNCKIM